MIDAQTGQEIYEYDLYCNAEIRGSVKTTTWGLPGQLGGSPDIMADCQDLEVTVTGVGSTNTNSSGYYSVSVPSSGNYTVTSSLDGAHCWVTNLTGPKASYSHLASTASDENWTWQQADHLNEYFVFHYMNKAWHEFNDKVSGFSSNYWYMNKMEGRANDDFDPGLANGQASGTWISLTPLNHFGCSPYHEYSHNVIFQAHGGSWLGGNYNLDGKAMDEGLSDYYSCSFRNDPLRYAVNRRLDTKMKYPGSGGAHTRGQIIGGACWDLGHKSGMTLNDVNGLVYEAVSNIGYEETFGDFMDEILSADDNDGNIFNGTPHVSQICDAFVNDHAIFGSYLTGNISSDVTMYRSVCAIGSVAITSGKTLTVPAGVIFSFGSGLSLTANGTLNATSATFDRSSSSGQWGGITFNSGSSGSLSGCHINNASYGVKCNGVLPSITGCFLEGNTIGIWLNNVGSPVNHITNNAIGNAPGGQGIACYYSSPRIDGTSLNASFIHDNSIGVFCVGSAPTISNTDFKFNPNAIYLLNNSSATIGSHNRLRAHATAALYVSGPFFVNSAQSDIYQWDYPSGKAVIANSGAIVAGTYDYWGQSPPNPAHFSASGGATIYYLPGNGSPWGPILQKPVAEENGPSTHLMGGDVSGGLLDEHFFAAATLLAEGKVEEAREMYLEQWKSPSSPEARKYILGQLAQCYRLEGRKDFSDFLNTDVRSSVATDDPLYATMLELENLFLIPSQQYSKALENLQVLATNFVKDEVTHKNALFSLGYLHSQLLSNQAKGQEYFAQLKDQYPNDMLTWQARLISGEIDSLPSVALQGNQQTAGEPMDPDEVAMLANYPNPFNPTTTIRYQLPADGQVSLVVYDLLGREVAVLASGMHKAGYYSATWTAPGTSSGVYFATLRVSDEVGRRIYTKTNKLLFVK